MPGLRVLIAEDDPALRRLLVALLAARGHEVSGVQDGQAAWDRLRAGAACELLLTDVSMPGLCGLTLLGLARRARPDLDVVVMSAAPENRAPALRGGALAFLSKPFDGEELSAALAGQSSAARSGPLLDVGVTPTA